MSRWRISRQFLSVVLTEHSVFWIQNFFGQKEKELFANATGIETFFILEEDLQRFLEIFFFVFVQLEEEFALQIELLSRESKFYLIDGILNDAASIDMDDQQRIDRLDVSTHHCLKVMHESIANCLVHFQLAIVLK